MGVMEWCECGEVLDRIMDHGMVAEQAKADIVRQAASALVDAPVEEARRSNMRRRPVGLGVQGLADAFLMMRLPFESEVVRKLNKDIVATIYFAACEASCDLAVLDGPY